MDLKSTKAAVTSKTYDRNELDASTGNIYEKLEEFATPTENLEEIFENKEQIEVSKFYEKLPKPHAIAIEQWLHEKIYFRHTDADASE